MIATKQALTGRFDNAWKTRRQSTVNVPSIDKFMNRVVNAGGSIVEAKSVVPGVGYHAYCADTEGNLFGIMQQDPLAQLPEQKV
jgi:predicted enzyme related to lactoylglutathione lyase